MRVTFVSGDYHSGRVAVAKSLRNELIRSGRRAAWTDHNFKSTKDFGAFTVAAVVKNLTTIDELVVSGPQSFLQSVCAVLICEGVPPVIKRIECGDWKCE